MAESLLAHEINLHGKTVTTDIAGHTLLILGKNYWIKILSISYGSTSRFQIKYYKSKHVSRPPHLNVINF